MGDEVKVPGEETTFNYLQPYTILGYVGDNSFMVLTLNPWRSIVCDTEYLPFTDLSWELKHFIFVFVWGANFIFPIETDWW